MKCSTSGRAEFFGFLKLGLLLDRCQRAGWWLSFCSPRIIIIIIISAGVRQELARWDPMSPEAVPPLESWKMWTTYSWIQISGLKKNATILPFLWVRAVKFHGFHTGAWIFFQICLSICQSKGPDPQLRRWYRIIGRRPPAPLLGTICAWRIPPSIPKKASDLVGSS